MPKGKIKFAANPELSKLSLSKDSETIGLKKS